MESKQRICKCCGNTPALKNRLICNKCKWKRQKELNSQPDGEKKYLKKGRKKGTGYKSKETFKKEKVQSRYLDNPHKINRPVLEVNYNGWY